MLNLIPIAAGDASSRRIMGADKSAVWVEFNNPEPVTDTFSMLGLALRFGDEKAVVRGVTNGTVFVLSCESDSAADNFLSAAKNAISQGQRATILLAKA